MQCKDKVAIITGGANGMTMDEAPLESTRDLGMYYFKKYANDPAFMAYIVSRV